ncbi:ParB N-terminal domain-containing protein [Corallococcus sp. AB030]|uniref:ParB N-terminal domain-containing protein n=1 Tax=Corallococcus sp. AB030 TaxID=2316716 RepID=UPI0011E5963D|nr:ParB N-terminal domain-containing protein [Corallococcus sp. AB030]
MENRPVHLNFLESVFPAEDEFKTAMLGHSIECHGWVGRPVVVVPSPLKKFRFLALSGRHRLAGAKSVRWDIVDTVVLTPGTHLSVDVTPEGYVLRDAAGSVLEKEALADYLRSWAPEAADLVAPEKQGR